MYQENAFKNHLKKRTAFCSGSIFLALLGLLNEGRQCSRRALKVNHLRAIFFQREHKRFMSFPHTNKTQVVEIPPRVRQGPAYST